MGSTGAKESINWDLLKKRVGKLASSSDMNQILFR